MNGKMPLKSKIVLMSTYGNYLKLRYRLKVIGKEKVKDLKGPAIVFVNHTHTLDPFWVSVKMPFHIRWVAGSYLFRMPLVSHLLSKWLGAISKTQGRSDLETIRSISKALKENDIIGLFPEGTRTWDGNTVDIVGSTAKLVRMFRVPVVFINIEGGFAKKPRWADKERKGSVFLHVMKVLYPEEIQKMSLPEISAEVEENLMFSHDEWIEKHPEIEYRGPVAEGIERVLYICPECRSIQTYVSSQKSAKCSCCSSVVNVDSHYRLSSDSIAFTKISQWHSWEREYMHELYEKSGEKSLIFPEEKGVLFQKATDKELLDLADSYSLKCYKNRFEFAFDKEVEGSKTKVFSFDEIESLIINAKQTVEFFYNGIRYRFRPYGKISSLKYQALYNEFRKHKEIEK